MPSAPANKMDQVFKLLNKGDGERALESLGKLDVNDTNKKGFTPLIGGIHAGDEDFVEALKKNLENISGTSRDARRNLGTYVIDPKN